MLVFFQLIFLNGYFFNNTLKGIKNLGYSNQLAITTTTMTTMNIVTQNTRK